MPKEMVTGTGFNFDETRGVRAEVRWSKEAEHVQIATLADEMPLGHNLVEHASILIEFLAGAETVPDPLKAAADKVRADLEELRLYDAHGWFCDLDRRGINALIRHLRRARDQSFGRDE